MGDLAKVFWDGRDQAVRLPEQFRVEGSELRISREGRKIVLEPVEEENGGDWIDAIAGKLDEDFAKLALSRPGPDETMNWVDRLQPLDEDAAAAALERPGPDSYERPDIKLD